MLAALAMAAIVPSALAQAPLSNASWRRLPPPAAELQIHERLPSPAWTNNAEATAKDGAAESLDEAIATALALDPWLDAHRWRARAAGSSLRSTEAEAYPWADVGASYTLRNDEPSFVTPSSPWLPGGTTFPYSQREGAGYFAALHAPVYTSGRIPALIEAAESRSGVSELHYKIALRDMRLRVAEEFIAVLRARCERELAQTTAESLAAHARDVEMLFRHEQRPRHDLLAAQVALADARYAVIVAENGFDTACAAYNRRLARPLDHPVRLRDLPLDSRFDDVDALQALAISQREELAQLATQARALAREADAVRARNRPQAELTGGYQFSENRFQSPEGIASLGIGVIWNVFDAGRDRHHACELEQQAAALHRLRADEQSRIQLEVRRCWLAVHETRKRLQVTHDALAQADENLRVTRERYANGMGTNADVLAAESLRWRSFRNHHHAHYDAVLASLRLERAVGG